MGKRGWTKADIQKTVEHPHQTGRAIDRTSGDEPVTVYFDATENYVVVNDRTGNVVQLSDKTDSDWQPDSSFVYDE
ncbi:hypothetical protein HYR99_15705 [Candidatus Poribacteria bacterium]|nr:hypothetical protein [Candidatus Poribacteria bacterium]